MLTPTTPMTPTMLTTADDADDPDAGAGSLMPAADDATRTEIRPPTPAADAADGASTSAGRWPLVVGRGSGGGVGCGSRPGCSRWWGLDQRPADVLGWGPVHAELAAELALRLRSWWCVLTDADGLPQAIVPIRRRPAPPTGPAGGHDIRARCGCTSTPTRCIC